MPSKNTITRRDFINGIALGLGASTALSPLELLAKQKATSNYYPPASTGLRGSHKGAFEVAHSVAWQGKKWPIPNAITDKPYDLVVVGGGISGLSAALLFQQQTGPDARILILENHDDFGGHAKRNEFTVDGKKLIAYGGSQSIEDPSHYSKEAKKLLRDISIDTDRFYEHFDQTFYDKQKLKYGIFFDETHYRTNKLTDNFYDSRQETPGKISDIIASYPISKKSQQSLIDLTQGSNIRIPKEWTYQERIEQFRKISFYDFLQTYTSVTEEAANVFIDSPKSIWGLGWDALSTLEAIRMGAPGSEHLGINLKDISSYSDDFEHDPYIFHFPDGNAGVAKGLVRKLIPNSTAGTTMEDLVLNNTDYSQLDLESHAVRIRLNSTAVNVQHDKQQQAVNVSYVHNNQTYKVQGKHCILACYNNIIPYICPEISDQQKDAIEYASKVPLVYTNIAIRNWRAFAESGYSGFFMPQQSLSHRIMMDYPVSMGGYNFTQNPDQPTVLHALMAPNKPHQNLSGRDQHNYGRHKLYQTSFDEYEQHLFQQLDSALSPYGFDPVKDIAGITVNRWPHGYAYEYNELFDPAGWSPKKGPHIAGRQAIGRISIANSDSQAYAYVNSAIDAAARAVSEQLKWV